MKHKHCDVIKAWADGAQIQTRMSVDEKWIAWPRQDISPCFHSDVEYRVKPEKKQLWARPYKGEHTGESYVASDPSSQSYFLTSPATNWIGPAVLIWEES